MIDRLERLLNLVIALRETRRPLLASEIRERVAGYGQPDPEAFRRMFERDKADLRALGVPVETTQLDRWDDRVGYRIDPAAYDLPPVRLEPGELTALALALAATGLADDAGAGLAKLEVSTAIDTKAPDDLPPAGSAARTALAVALDAPHRRELMEAQLTRTPVRFRYRPLQRPAEERTVDPHALVHRGGFWYLVGHDHDRGARRAFRLDRFAGPVQSAGEAGAFAPAAEVSVDDVVPRLSSDGPEQAVVAAEESVAWMIARRALGGGHPETGADGGPTGRSLFTVAVGDPDAFLRWVLEYGPDVEVIAPEELRGSVIERLRSVQR